MLKTYMSGVHIYYVQPVKDVSANDMSSVAVDAKTPHVPLSKLPAGLCGLVYVLEGNRKSAFA